MSLPIDHARLPKPGDIFGEKYRLECILGSGGMGVVFGATHLITHKRVAIKWLAGEAGGGSLSDTTQRFVREARLVGEFQHPNVVQVYDLGESDGSFYMVMEWLDGESLASRLERERRLSFEEATRCLIPCMHAMQRAHDAGIIHRDIKPANIFLCEPTSDRPALSKVLDFGISKRITTNADMSFVTKTGMLVGTPHYLAPEQLRARPVDRRTDIYGFGVLLYQTLAGELPFIADNFGDLVVAISVGTPRSLRDLVPDLPVGVEQVVARAMARDPEERFGSLHELIASLNAIDPSPLTAATLPQLHTPPQAFTQSSLRPIATRAHAARPKSATWPWVVTAGVSAGALLGGFLWVQSESARVEPSAIVRPRAVTRAVADDVLPPSASDLNMASDAIPSGAQQFPQLDAAVRDSGRPIPLDPAPPRDQQPKTKPAAVRIATKPATPEAVQRPDPTSTPEPQPSAATPAITLQPTPEPRVGDRNPLHMDIQRHS
ncbi:MAG TPA: protein kinase, partial [Polyangiales bacterium]|nr:protein kinase [Polyangiales bacterium]